MNSEELFEIPRFARNERFVAAEVRRGGKNSCFVRFFKMKLTTF